MKNKHWLFQLPVIALFVACYLVTEFGTQGYLEVPFLREQVFPMLSRASNMLTDIKFKVRGPQPLKNKIVIVEIDSPALESLGRWPWHRDVMAYLIEKTFAAGAKVVGLDMVFSETDPRVPAELNEILKFQKLGDLTEKFETDQILQKVIAKHADHLVLGWVSESACQPHYEQTQNCPVLDPQALAQFQPGFEKFALDQFFLTRGFEADQTPMISFVTMIPNIPLYSNSAMHAGYLNAFLDSDGYVRRTSLFGFANRKPFPSLPLAMARIGLNEKIQLSLDENQRVKGLGFINSGKAIPVSPLGSMQVNYRGPSLTITRIPALDLLSEKDTLEDPLNRKLAGYSKAEVLRDAYVLIGITALGVHDMRQFPFDSNAPGVDGHAQILDNLLSGDALVPGTTGWGSVIVFLLMSLGVIAFAYAANSLDAVPALLLFIIAFSGLGFWDLQILFSKNNNWNTVFLYIEIFTVFILTLAAKYVLEEKNKKFIRGAFSKYVPPAVVDSILKDPTKLSLGGEKREMTILFSDIRSFTTFSETMDAKSLASFLNDYLGIMTGLVFKNQGTLDKYIGDAVMAFWGAPLEQREHGYNAIQAALQMMDALHQNQARYKSQYGIDVNVGIGINSGVVNVGNMGSDQNFEYTVIGDHVNLASRVEGLTKKYGVSILTTRFTFETILKSEHQLVPHRVLDDVKVKGKKNSVQLIEVLDRPRSEQGLLLFNEGRDLYRQQKWSEAVLKFQESNRLLALGEGIPDGPSEVYLERCEWFKKNPPAPDWDGSWEMDSK